MDCNEGHAESCACLRPGDRECDCHKSYGFETAEDMDIADASKGSACACPLDHRGQHIYVCNTPKIINVV